MRLASAVNWMAEQVAGLVADERRHTVAMEQRLLRLHPQRMLDQRRQQLDERERRLHRTAVRRLDRLVERIGAMRLQLEALNPLRVLARGYSVVQHGDGRVVSGPAELAAGERLHVRAVEGSYDVMVASSNGGT
jgi:exodeoxyribonuclease VII large subunit